MSPALVASINGRRIGCLRDQNGYWTWQYDESWIEDGYPISPGFPLRAEVYEDSGTTRQVAWFFDNLLPEENARETLAKDAALAVDDAWGLLAFFGAESAGAITLLREGAELAPGGLLPLSNEALQRRIDNMPRRSLVADAPKKMSLAGAQQKLAVTVVNGTIFEPTGNRCSTHILKPDSKTDGYPHTAANEFFCMRLAGSLKLPVPKVELRHVPWPIYLSERFDREQNEAGLVRSHALDGLQLLSLDRRLKYTKASAETLMDCIQHCGAPLRTKQDVFTWIVFNVLIGNSDAHMKNISFIVDKAGIRLSPFYDLVSTVVYDTPGLSNTGPYWPHVELSMPLGNARLFSEVRRQHLLQVAEALKLGRKPATRILNTLVAKMPGAAEALLKHMPANDRLTVGEARLLNSICVMPIAEMSRQLRV